MPPKKDKAKDDTPPAVPEAEQPVELPAELAEEFVEPSFCLVLGHLFGHQFRIEEPEKEGSEAGEQPEGGPPIVDYDPCARLVARSKEPEDALLKNIGVVERDELQAAANAENVSLLAALRSRLQKERAARSMAKVNRAKRRAIEALEAAKAREAEEGEPPAEPPAAAALAAAREEPGAKADFVLLLRDYPSSVEEIQELSSERLCADGLIDLWASVYLAGETLEEAAGEEAEPQEPRLVACETPDFVRLLHSQITSAPSGSELADCALVTHRGSQDLAVAGEERAQGERVQAAVISVLSTEVAAKVRYRDWIKKPMRVSVPSISEHDKYSESRLYQRMMGSVDPQHHDIPLFLHCLSEQVERTLGGGVQEQESSAAFSSLQEYMGTAFLDILTEGAEPPRSAPQLGEACAAEAEVRSVRRESAVPAAVPNLADCVHRLGADNRGGSKVLGREPVADIVEKVLSEVHVPGVKRSGLPKDAVHSSAQLEALRSRMYPFAPVVSPVECEQMALLHAFEQLLEKAQPERRWQLTDRNFRELIPREFLAKTLEAALHNEPFMDTVYLPRLDCLLIALHHRSLPGRVMWHSWKGDLLADPDSDRWEGGLFTVPTYNDWSLAFGAGPTAAPGAVAPQPRRLLEGFDARIMGYAGTVEKLATPADGSIILVTKTQIGLQSSCPLPANELPASFIHSDASGMECGETVIGDGNESAVTGATTAVPDMPGEAASTLKWDASPARSSRLARVMKDGLTFGIVEDASWKQWCRGERGRFAREAEAAVAALAAAAADGDAEGSQPAPSGPASASGDPMVQPEALEPPFQGSDLGTLWVSFPGGARCTARMHHERVLAEAAPYESASELAAEALPAMGVLLTYTMCSGQVIQVFSDGSVRLSWPLALHDGMDASGAVAALAAREPASAHSTLSGKARLPAAGDRSHFEPGCPEDVEMQRTVTPFGSLVRRLLSGRVEVCHADGTIATRNPTAEELRRQLDGLKRERCSAAFAPRLELLERLCQVYGERYVKPLTEPPSERAKAAGLPGHWVVVRPDGRVFGRGPVPPAPPPDPPRAGAAGDAAGDAEGDAAGDAAPPASARSDGGAAVTTEAASEPSAPPFHELLGGVLIDGGAAVEYDITPISKALQVDLQSHHRTFTNQFGLAAFEDPEGVQRVNVHTDGTQVVRTQQKSAEGYEVSISKVPFAHIRCIVTTSPADEGLLVVVECSDGTRIEVVPQMKGPHYADLVPLTPNAEDLISLSTNASAVLECRSGAKVVSTGSGQVDVLTGPGGGGYTALCHEGRLVLRDEQCSDFELRTDQTLSVSEPRGGFSGGGLLSASYVGAPSPQSGSGSPRCLMARKAYRWPGSEGEPPPDVPPAPRLFAVYGDGRAEELLRADEATKLLADASGDPTVVVSGGQPLGPQLEMCQSHCIFRVRMPDANVVPSPPSIALPEGCDNSPSLGSLQALPSLTALPALTTAPPVTEFRQLVEYPPLTEELRRRFRGTLKQYRQWEADMAVKRRAFMVPEPKGKKDAKKEVKKEPPQKKKEKRGKKHTVVEAPVVEVVEARPEPAFVPDLQLTPFDHLVQVLRARANEAPMPSAAELLAHAKLIQESDNSVIEPVEELGDAGNEEITSLTIAVDGSTPGPPSPTWEVHSAKGSPEGALLPPAERPASGSGKDAEAASATEVSAEMTLRSAGLSQPAEAARKGKRPAAAEAEMSFSYFQSDAGMQFLMESGLHGKELSTKAGDAKAASCLPRAKQYPSKRSPWNPRLVGEPSEEAEPEEQTEAEPLDAGHGMAEEAMVTPASEPSHAHFMDQTPISAGGGFSDEQTFAPAPRVPIVPENHEAAVGPHPSKKGANWDVYGEPRPQRPPVSQAHVEVNSAYMEIEGATDRRVRTSSIAHKKNAAKAPSVSTVRKTGTHALGRGTEIGAQEILGDMGIVGGQEEHWKLTSTMQGLGDSNNLVEVTPGACRFGPLRLGAVYRMNIHVRNLDVDVTRFNVVPEPSEYVRVNYTPGHLAPGMAAKISVEILSLSPAKIERLVEVRLKAHVVSVPVTARIFDAEEYDRLDAESLAINGRRIGRHREKDERNKAGPVQLIQDEAYCRKLMGDKYQKPPGDLDADGL